MELKKHNVTYKIQEIIDYLDKAADSSENGRAKALVKTKLEEGLLWSLKIYE